MHGGAGDQADRDAPVLLVAVAGGENTVAVVARRRGDADLQDALGRSVGSEDEVAGQPGSGAGARGQQLGRGRGDGQRGRVAEPGVEVLAGGRGERDPQGDGAGARSVRERRTRCAPASTRVDACRKIRPSGIRTGRCAADSTTTSASPSTSTSDGSRRSRAKVVAVRVTGRSGGSRRCRCRRSPPKRRAAPRSPADAAAAPARHRRHGGRSRTTPARRPSSPHGACRSAHRTPPRRPADELRPKDLVRRVAQDRPVRGGPVRRS